MQHRATKLTRDPKEKQASVLVSAFILGLCHRHLILPWPTGTAYGDSQKGTQEKDRHKAPLAGDPLAHNGSNRNRRCGFTPRPLSHSYVVPLGEVKKWATQDGKMGQGGRRDVDSSAAWRG